MSRGTLDPAGLLTTSDTGLSPSLAGCSNAVLLSFADPFTQSEPRDARITVWALPLSLAATDGIDVSFSSSGYLDVSVHRVPLHALWIHAWIRKVCLRRFPHSDIHGSMDICSSPWLFAAYHVLLRLLVPRHPPCALSSITNSIPSAGTEGIFTCIALHVLAVLSVSLVSRLSAIHLGCLDIFLYLLYAVFKVHSD